MYEGGRERGRDVYYCACVSIVMPVFLDLITSYLYGT